MEKNIQKYQLFFKKKLISIYFGSRPKRFIHIFSNYFFLYNIIYFFENIYLINLNLINKEYKYTEKEIEIFKEDVFKIMNGEIKKRGPSQKRNYKLKGKKYNKRKTK